MVWTMQDAKNKFSEVVERARQEGPQRVQRHGKDAVYVVSSEEWSRLQGSNRSLADLLLSSPLAWTELVVDRDRSVLREVDL